MSNISILLYTIVYCSVPTSARSLDATGLLQQLPSLKNDCNNTEVLLEIRKYLEKADFAQAFYRSLVDAWFNPQVFWDNVNKIKNICESEEAKYLRNYCHKWPNMTYFILHDFKNNFNQPKYSDDPMEPHPFVNKWDYFGRHMILNSLPSGKMAEHYCDRVSGLPLTEPINYLKVNWILQKLFTADPENTGNKHDHINFAPEIQEHLDKGSFTVPLKL